MCPVLSALVGIRGGEVKRYGFVCCLFVQTARSGTVNIYIIIYLLLVCAVPFFNVGWRLSFPRRIVLIPGRSGKQ